MAFCLAWFSIGSHLRVRHSRRGALNVYPGLCNPSPLHTQPHISARMERTSWFRPTLVSRNFIPKCIQSSLMWVGTASPKDTIILRRDDPHVCLSSPAVPLHLAQGWIKYLFGHWWHTYLGFSPKTGAGRRASYRQDLLGLRNRQQDIQGVVRLQLGPWAVWKKSLGQTGWHCSCTQGEKNKLATPGLDLRSTGWFGIYVFKFSQSHLTKTLFLCK